MASQFHVRMVKEVAEGWTMLAEGNECFVSRDGMMLGIQAHPEIGGAFGRRILEGDDGTYTGGMSEEGVREKRERMGDEQDGMSILSRIVEWVGER